jgi:hypothetical protein
MQARSHWFVGRRDAVSVYRARTCAPEPIGSFRLIPASLLNLLAKDFKEILPFAEKRCLRFVQS